jgi:hypothetical protein
MEPASLAACRTRNQRRSPDRDDEIQSAQQAVGLVKVRPKVLFPSLESIAAQLPDILLKIPLRGMEKLFFGTRAKLQDAFRRPWQGK